jgi:hypothetical protein
VNCAKEVRVAVYRAVPCSCRRLPWKF